MRAPKVACVFPLNQFTPESLCPKGHKIKRGRRLYCPICHASGLDHYEMVKLKAKDILPRHETPESDKPKLTRKQRRELARKRLRDLSCGILQVA